MSSYLYNTRSVIEFACSAYRLYGEYIIENQYRLDDTGNLMFTKYSNKILVLYALGILKYRDFDAKDLPMQLFVSQEDIDEAERILKHFRKLTFKIIKGNSSKFETELNTLLSSEEIPGNKIGYLVCLPYIRTTDGVNKCLENADNETLGEENTWIFDKDCNILQVKKSVKYDAWNMLAIIDNKIVSWMSKKSASVGDAVLQKAKVKAISVNYKTGKKETRLNYVKVAQ